jgi:hypothetical protein
MPNAHFKDYFKVGIVVVEENNELIEEIDYFEKLKVDGD